jgi:hypothetical protein
LGEREDLLLSELVLNCHERSIAGTQGTTRKKMQF